jgi:hypothetical protein
MKQLKSEIKDLAFCAKCGGKCCNSIYGNKDRNPYASYQGWMTEFHDDREGYGVEPFFDPRTVLLNGNEHLLEQLEARGVNPYACEYKGVEGCIIEWSRRPRHCRTYACEDLKKHIQKQKKS